MSKIILTLCLMTPFLTACATSGQNNYCQLARPIYLDKKDSLTINTQREILKHDEKGAELCGWKKV